MRKEVQLELQDGVSQNIEVEVLDERRLRLLDSPMFTDGDLRLGTVVEVERLCDDGYRVKRVLSQSDYQFKTQLIGPTSEAKKLRIREVCARHGVVPEMFIEGQLYLNLPPATPESFFEEFNSACNEPD